MRESVRVLAVIALAAALEPLMATGTYLVLELLGWETQTNARVYFALLGPRLVTCLLLLAALGALSSAGGVVSCMVACAGAGVLPWGDVVPRDYPGDQGTEGSSQATAGGQSRRCARRGRYKQLFPLSISGRLNLLMLLHILITAV